MTTKTREEIINTVIYNTGCAVQWVLACLGLLLFAATIAVMRLYW